MSAKSKIIEIAINGNRCDVIVPPGQKRYANKILRSADDQGIIQAEKMVKLFPGMGNKGYHTTATIGTAFHWAEFEIRPQD